MDDNLSQFLLYTLAVTAMVLALILTGLVITIWTDNEPNDMFVKIILSVFCTVGVGLCLFLVKIIFSKS